MGHRKSEKTLLLKVSTDDKSISHVKLKSIDCIDFVIKCVKLMGYAAFIDFDTIEDNCATIRDRDTMEQVKAPSSVI